MAYKDYPQILLDLIQIEDGEAVQEDIANRPHEQAFLNEDYLASVINADRLTVLSGGGNISWDGTTLSVPNNLYIDWPNEQIDAGIGGGTRSTISPFNINMGANLLAVVIVDRTANFVYGAGSVVLYPTMAVFKAAIEASPNTIDRFAYLIIAAKDLNNAGNPTGNLIIWDGRRLRPGFTWQNAGVTDAQYAQQSELTGLRSVVNQDRNTALLGGGLISWAGPGSGLVLAADLDIVFPVNMRMRISAGTLPAINLDQVYRVVVTRTPDGVLGTPSVVVVNRSLILKTDLAFPGGTNTFVLAHCHTDGRLYLDDGTALDAGQSAFLGNATTGVKWRYTGVGTGAAVFDFATAPGDILPSGAVPEFMVGEAELLIWVDGVFMADGRFVVPDGDYLEGDTDTPGTLSTKIRWTPETAVSPIGRIPGPGNKIQALVAMANPNRGLVGPAGGVNTIDVIDGGLQQLVGNVDVTSPNGTIELTKVGVNGLGIDVDDTANITTIQTALDDGTPIGTQKVGDVKLREDADRSVLLSDAGFDVRIEVGPYIEYPVHGVRTDGVGGAHGGLRMLNQRPQMMFADGFFPSGSFFVTPGEVSIPDVVHAQWLTYRNYTPQLVVTTNPANQIPGDVLSMVYPKPIYVYATPDVEIVHDAPFRPVYGLTPPVQYVISGTDWLAHPSDPSLVYIGAVIADNSGIPVFPGATPNLILPFDRIGSATILRPGSRFIVGFIGPIPPGLVVDVKSHVPWTATGIRFQFAASSTAPGFYGLTVFDKKTAPAPWIPGIGDFAAAHYVATDAVGGALHIWSPVDIPSNNQTGPNLVPNYPEIAIEVSPGLANLGVLCLGWVEDTDMYRHQS